MVQVRLRIPRSSLARFRVAAWALPVVLALALGGLRHRWRAEADVACGLDRLEAGRPAEAVALLAPHAAGARAAGGLALARAWLGRPATASPPAGLHPLPVLDAVLGAGDAGAALRVAALVRECGEPLGGLYAAAALVELGRDDEARRALEATGGAFAGWGLERDARRVLELRSLGATRIVRDRHGVLVGALLRGELSVEPGLAGFVPPEVRQAAAAAPPGRAGLRLGLDLELSRQAEQALSGLHGTVVLLDPRTGELLAAVSDPASLAREDSPAFAERREPASISKLVTAAAAARVGLDPDAEIARMTCPGFGTYGKGRLWCASPAGKLTGLDHALAVSCNVAFANLGVRVGRAALLAELRRFGFDEPGAAWAGHVTQPEGDERQLADLSVGLEATDITPLHAAVLGSVFADGSLRLPVLLAGDDGALGRTPRFASPPPPLREVVPAPTLSLLRRAMEAVAAPGGTAAGVAPEGYPVAMKTGTAREPGLGYHVNYVGVAPLPSPRYAFCLRLTHQPTSPRVSLAARLALADLLARLAELSRRPGRG